MPAPAAAMMSELAKMQFRSFAIKLPVDWKTPSGDPAGAQYSKAFTAAEHAAVPSPVPPGLFSPASTNKYHCDAAGDISDKLSKFIDGICGAICSAWSQWQSTAALVGVVINGPTASLGQVVGIPLMPLIMASAPKATAQELKYSTAIAQTIGTGWLSYTATIKVPGLPWYPAFTAFPGPVAPPMPNIPTPVVALMQVTAAISKPVLKAQMIGALGDPKAFHHQELFDCVSDAFEKCFQIWQASTQVMNVLGTGPIPTFAPPFVPVGPVVGGVGTMPPGGFV
jgi:hypothetical protein